MDWCATKELAMLENFREVCTLVPQKICPWSKLIMILEQPEGYFYQVFNYIFPLVTSPSYI